MSSPGKSCDLCGGEQRKAECNSSCEMYLYVRHVAPFWCLCHGENSGGINKWRYVHKLIEPPPDDELMYQMCYILSYGWVCVTAFHTLLICRKLVLLWFIIIQRVFCDVHRWEKHLGGEVLQSALYFPCLFFALWSHCDHCEAILI